ncbi:MAG: hypothetical protein V7742_21860 [Halioglobus sp.]
MRSTPPQIVLVSQTIDPGSQTIDLESQTIDLESPIIGQESQITGKHPSRHAGVRELHVDLTSLRYLIVVKNG